MFDILGIIKDVIRPVTDLIDSMHTSDEEKLKAKEKLLELENELTVRAIDYQTELMQSRAKVIEAEAKGDSWLQRSWRPITMLTFLFMLLTFWFGLMPTEILILLQELAVLDEVFALLKIGIGGYIGGRSLEKIARDAPKAIDAIKGNTPEEEAVRPPTSGRAPIEGTEPQPLPTKPPISW